MTVWQKVRLALTTLFTLAIFTSPLRAEVTICMYQEDFHELIGMLGAPYKDAGNSVVVFAEEGTEVWVWVWIRSREQWCWTEGERA